MPHASKRFKIQRESLQKANETRLERLKSKKDKQRSVIRGENGAGGSPLVSPPPPDTSPPPAPRPIDLLRSLSDNSKPTGWSSALKRKRFLQKQ